jgi:hypothetical protein
MRDLDAIRAFATRSREAVDRSRAAYWRTWRSRHCAEDALRLGDELRRHAAQVRPDSPGAASRREDLRTHARVAEALRRVPPRRG